MHLMHEMWCMLNFVKVLDNDEDAETEFMELSEGTIFEGASKALSKKL